MKKFILTALLALALVFSAEAEIYLDLNALYRPFCFENLNVTKIRGIEAQKNDGDELYTLNDWGIKAGFSYIWDDSPSPSGPFTFYPGFYADFTYANADNAVIKFSGNDLAMKAADGQDFLLAAGIKGRFQKWQVLYLDLFFGLDFGLTSITNRTAPKDKVSQFSAGAELGAEAEISLGKPGRFIPILVIGTKAIFDASLGRITEEYYSQPTTFGASDVSVQLMSGLRFRI